MHVNSGISVEPKTPYPTATLQTNNWLLTVRNGGTKCEASVFTINILIDYRILGFTTWYAFSKVADTKETSIGLT